MGVTIKSKSRSIDLGGGGFRRLRTKVAELAAPDIFEHYKKLGEGMWYPNRKAFFKDYDEKIAELDKKYKAKCLTSLIFCMKAIVMLRWMQTIAGQFMKSLKTTMTISYMAMPAEKTVQNSLISKKSSRMVLIPAMDSAGAKNCKKKTKKIILTPDGGKGQNYEDFSN